MTSSADAAAKVALTRRRLLPRLGAMGSAGLMAAALASCGAGSQSSGSGAAPAAKVKSGTVVQWMLQSQAGPNLEADTRTAALFEQAYADKGLKVDRQQSLAGKDYLDKVTALFASGTPPHVIWLLPTDVAPYQAKKLLLDLTTLAKRDKFDFADFF